MLKQERISFRRKIEKAADDFLDLVTEILEKRNKEKNTATLG